ncbi:MAG TPA: RecX family transcriptional regulator [Thermoanaerobaculia bacterium]|nr:RecX family transcriptional regulator [Thermoanaerobaculia bacterium]
MSDDLERCYAAALRILNYRFNSEAELRRKLRAKRFEAGLIDRTIERLRGERWLDDQRFAAALVRTKQQKHHGRRKIARELAAAGIDRESADRALRENADPEKERQDLVALFEKRRRLMIRRHGEAYVSTEEARRKLAAYLLNRGYDAALVQSVVKEIPVVHD